MDGKQGAKMAEIASMDRTSGFVRTLVRMQLSQNRRSGQEALDRLYERMKERGEEVEIEGPKLKRIREAANASDLSSATDEDDDTSEGEVIEDARKRSQSLFRASAEKALLRTSTGFLYTPRRFVRTPSPGKPTEDTETQPVPRRPYTVQSPNHGLALNRGLTLAENVRKNYTRFIRTDSAKTQNARAEGVGTGVARAEGVGTGVARAEGANTGNARTERGASGRQVKTDGEQPEMDAPDNRKPDSICLARSSVRLNRSKTSLGLTTTAEDHIPVEMARSGSTLSLPRVTSLPTTPEPRQLPSVQNIKEETTPQATTARMQRVNKGTKGKTEGRFHKRDAKGGEKRAEVLKELRKAHGTIEEHMKEARLRQARVRVKAYKREQLLRAERMAIFQREMDDIMKRLRDINNRLDGRLRLLERDESLTKMEP